MPKLLLPGDAAPYFVAPTLGGSGGFSFDSAAGRPILLLFAGSASWPQSGAALDVVKRHRALFDDGRASFFGVSTDPTDVAEQRIARDVPGVRWFLDYDLALSRQFGAVDDIEGGIRYSPHWVLLDPALRIVEVAGVERGEQIIAALRAGAADVPADVTAPVLVVPRIFEPELCRRLIAGYEADGGSPTGFMRHEDGKTFEKIDRTFKRRSDWLIRDDALGQMLLARLSRFLAPAIKRAFQFDATRVERLLVSRYDGADHGFFKPHRDDNLPGTEHRRFACTLNLNAEDYDGGELRFPEFGRRTYRAPTGGAVIFSCSMLHEATPVTRGQRYAFLPFLYDEAGQRQRDASEHLLVSRDLPPMAGAAAS